MLYQLSQQASQKLVIVLVRNKPGRWWVNNCKYMKIIHVNCLSNVHYWENCSHIHFFPYICAINSYLPQPKETRKNYNGHVNHSIKQTKPCFQKRTSFMIADQVFITKKNRECKTWTMSTWKPLLQLWKAFCHLHLVNLSFVLLCSLSVNNKHALLCNYSSLSLQKPKFLPKNACVQRTEC